MVWQMNEDSLEAEAFRATLEVALKETLLKDVNEKLEEAHERLAEAHQTIGRLRSDIEEMGKTLLVLKVWTRIEEYERKFLPPSMLTLSELEKWNIIVKSNEPYFRNNQDLQHFRANLTDLNENIFVETIANLHNNFSGIASALFSVPQSKSAIVRTFDNLGITFDAIKVRVVEEILKPIKVPFRYLGI